MRLAMRATNRGASWASPVTGDLATLTPPLLASSLQLLEGSREGDGLRLVVVEWAEERGAGHGRRGRRWVAAPVSRGEGARVDKE